MIEKVSVMKHLGRVISCNSQRLVPMETPQQASRLPLEPVLWIKASLPLPHIPLSPSPLTQGQKIYKNSLTSFSIITAMAGLTKVIKGFWQVYCMLEEEGQVRKGWREYIVLEQSAS